MQLTLDIDEYVVFDLETTGLSPWGGDEIIEIGAMKIFGQQIDENLLEFAGITIHEGMFRLKVGFNGCIGNLEHVPEHGYRFFNNLVGIEGPITAGTGMGK